MTGENRFVMASYLVTGTSRGLGLAMVTHLATSSDIEVVFAGARSQTPQLEKIVAQSAGKIVYIEMDTIDQNSVDQAVVTVQEHLGDRGLDYLVNNAGIGGFAPGWTEE